MFVTVHIIHLYNKINIQPPLSLHEIVHAVNINPAIANFPNVRPYKCRRPNRNRKQQVSCQFWKANTNQQDTQQSCFCITLMPVLHHANKNIKPQTCVNQFGPVYRIVNRCVPPCTFKTNDKRTQQRAGKTTNIVTDI